MMRLSMDVLDPRWLIAPNKARPDQLRATSYDESKAFLPTKLFIVRVLRLPTGLMRPTRRYAARAFKVCEFVELV